MELCIPRRTKRGPTIEVSKTREVEVQLLPDGMLVCPLCGDSEMHHQSVEILNRRTEDGDGWRIKELGDTPQHADTLTQGYVSGNSAVSIEPAKSSEIPGRRDAIKIKFWCEQCHDWGTKGCITLVIYQCKGSTMFVWDK